MSTPRYPRTRIYRDLARLQVEVEGWYREYLAMAAATTDPRDERHLFERAYELQHLGWLIHQAADQAGGVYRLRLNAPLLVARLDATSSHVHGLSGD